MGVYVMIVAQQEFLIGQDIFLVGESPQGRFYTVFSEDENTGYFYACDSSDEEQPIRDALHIYNVANVVDREKPSIAKIGWSNDGLKAMLLINDNYHAIFDFSAKRGCCRTGFPPRELSSDEGWSLSGHDWDEQALKLFSTPIG